MRHRAGQRKVRALKLIAGAIAILGWLPMGAVPASAQDMLTYDYTGNDLFQTSAPYQDVGPLTGTATFDIPLDYTGDAEAAAYSLDLAGFNLAVPGNCNACSSNEQTFQFVNGVITQWSMSMISSGAGIGTVNFEGDAVDGGELESTGAAGGVIPGIPANNPCNETACQNVGDPGTWTLASVNGAPPSSGSPTSAACQADIASGIQKPIRPLSSLSLSLQPTQITDSFTPSVGLAQAAADCGVLGFDWVQKETLNGQNAIACGDPACTQQITIPAGTTYNDPSPYGYLYCNPSSAFYNPSQPDCSHSNPYVYPISGEADLYCVEAGTNGCVTPLETLTSLNFFDSPDAAPGGSFNFTTELVGISDNGSPVPFPLDSFSWYDDFSDQSCLGLGCGGIAVTPISALPVDYDAGTGGITLLSNQEVPEPSSFEILAGSLVVFAGGYFVRSRMWCVTQRVFELS